MNRLLIFLILLLQVAASRADVLPEGVSGWENKGEYCIDRIDERAGKNVIIPEKVTIKIYSTEKEYPITSISISSSIKDNNVLETLIAPHVTKFYNDGRFTKLTKVVLGENLESIYGLTKNQCPSLKELQWNPSTIKAIGTAFTGQSEIFKGTLRFGENLENIGLSAFKDCRGIQTIDLSRCKNLKYIDPYAFCGSDLKDISFTEGVFLINSEAFKNCTELSPGASGTLELPKSCTSIARSAFAGCTKLKNVKAYGWKTDDYDTKNGGSQFSGCTSLISVSLPNDLEYIPISAFSGCENLKDIVTEAYQNQSGVIFPKTVKIIGKNAFSGCKSLTNKTKDYGKITVDIKMPDAIEKVDEEAFSNCTGLISISFPDPQEAKRIIIAYTNSFVDCTNLKNIDLQEPEKKDDIQDNPSQLQVSTMAKAEYSTTYGLVVNRGAFQGCTSLTSIPAPASVKSWSKGYDEGWAITTLRTPYYVKNVTTEDIDALVHPNIFSLSDIKNVYFHSATASVSQGALSSCINVDRVVFYAPEAEEQAEAPVLQIAPNAFAANKKLVNVECDYLVPPVIEENVFNNETYKAGCLTVPEGTTELYSKANGWKNFSLITDGQQSSISQIEAENNDSAVEYFDLQGRPVNRDNAAPGLYIRRQGSTSGKVVIR